MSLFKCKMCAGDLVLLEGLGVAECEYCGTKQTVPKGMDENLQSIFNRANTLRIKSEFDKAEKLYEKIIQVDATQADAYWGLILCKYGIEYVDDPATFKKIPTCHRASYDSVIADDDYKSALEHADMSQRVIYEEQAKEIDRIQKEILALAQKEETYDVFICYKETDANGQRTQDSVIANDIYYQLTNEGFKVFYAAITLEGKLGSAYEPIIFAALNSAKVMLAIGTKPEYFNAVWVKNEWSRFLKIIKKDRTKLLIPCYRDMDAYELPEEFAHLQAQDMGKIGFINDVVRGIKKVITKDEPKVAVVKETVIHEATAAPIANIAPLLERAFMFLEDGEFDRADEFCEQVLNQDPKNAEAYLGKMMAELHIKKRKSLMECEKTFENNNNYHKIIRFGDDKLKKELEEYTKLILQRNEEERLRTTYNQAISQMSRARNAEGFQKALELFKTVGGYKDADKLAQECIIKVELAKKEEIYNSARASMRGYESGYKTAISLFNRILDYKDSAEQIAICQENIRKIQAKAEADRLEADRKAELARLEAERQAELDRLEAERKARISRRNAKIKKIIVIIASVVLCLIIAVGILSIIRIRQENYNKAEQLYLSGNAEEAAEIAEKSFLSIAKAYRHVANENYRAAVEAGLKNIVIPNGVTSIGSFAFDGCSSLESITIPGSVTSIGDGAFDGCSSLESITIPDSIKSIGIGAFSNCLSLESITIPGSVTSISNYTFSGCSSLESIMITGSVKSIGNYAFSGCKSLKSVEFMNPNGWSASSHSISVSDLKDRSIAAKYLTDTYLLYSWTRK